MQRSVWMCSKQTPPVVPGECRANESTPIALSAKIPRGLSDFETASLWVSKEKKNGNSGGIVCEKRCAPRPQTRTCQIRHIPTSSLPAKHACASPPSPSPRRQSTMQTDVEMAHGEQPSSATSPAGGEPPSTPTRHRSPIIIDDSSAATSPAPHEHSPTSGAPSSPGVDESAPAAAATAVVVAVAAAEKKKGKSSASRPPSTAGAKSKATTKWAAAASVAGPPRSPSPSPPPQPPPPLAVVRPSLQTVRLDIKLGGPDNYEVNIASLAKESGQRPPTPTPVKRHDTSDDSHSEGDDEAEGNPQLQKRRKVRVLDARVVFFLGGT
jgi:hypothetical protein